MTENQSKRIVEALRVCAGPVSVDHCSGCPYHDEFHDNRGCADNLKLDAAAAIEAERAKHRYLAQRLADMIEKWEKEAIGS